MKTQDSYQPPTEILHKYAKVLVNFALGQDEGVSPGEVVMLAVPDIAKPLGAQLQKEVLKQGAHPLLKLLPTGLDKDFYELANTDQLEFFPNQYLKSRVQLVDHQIGIIADPYPEELKSVDPEKIVKARDAKKRYRDWLFKKENQGKFTWTAALWGVEAKAKIVGLTLEEYWQQIIAACFLDDPDPIARWREIKQLQETIKAKLNQLAIESVHVQGPDVDLKVKIGADRLWEGGADRNIPSFELFTSPNWRGTEGWIRFNQPVYRYGQVLSGIQLEFANGQVKSAKAKQGDSFLQAMLKSPNANKLGEFSLTDNRLSNITHFMAETLYDENMGGPEGNMHVALGSAYQSCYRGPISQLTKRDWQKLGFNDSAEHTDIVTTAPRRVTASLKSGKSRIIYQAGRFTL